MSSKTPIRTVFNDSNVATGLAEFQTGEFVPLSHGGIGAALSIGSAGQVLKVNTGGSALEFGFVEAIVNIDNPVKTANKLAIRLAPNLSAISPPMIVPAIPAVTAHPPVTAIYSASLHPSC